MSGCLDWVSGLDVWMSGVSETNDDRVSVELNAIAAALDQLNDIKSSTAVTPGADQAVRSARLRS